MYSLATASPLSAQPCSSAPPRAETSDEHFHPIDFVSIAHGDSAEARRLDSRRGLIVEQNVVREHYPLLLAIFFDVGSADIPARYQRLDDSTATSTFSEDTIRGGTLQKYHRLLDIVGARMRGYPRTTITLVGCNAGRASGETTELSRQRAETVRDYLLRTWRIDAGRIAVRARDLPGTPSTGVDSTRDAENARVEILTDAWELGRPLTQSELRLFPLQEVRFLVGAAPPHVARRRIEIERGGYAWHTLVVPVDDSATVWYDWGCGGHWDELPTDTLPFVVRVVSTLADGSECHSDTMRIPVAIIVSDRQLNDCRWGRRIDRFTLTLFPHNGSELAPRDERIIREIIAPAVMADSRVHVYGHTVTHERSASSVGTERAAAVATILQRALPVVGSHDIMTKGVGDEYPHYQSILPEGRFYNRTVQVVIETPEP